MKLSTGIRPPALSPIRTGYLLHSAWDQITDGEFELNFAEEYFESASLRTYTNFRRSIIAVLRTIRDAPEYDGREILLPRYCCEVFPAAVETVGFEVRYVDVNPETLTVDLGDLSRVSTENVAAVLPVNHFGLANQMDEIVDYCSEDGIALIEDLGYSLGVEYDGRPLGTFGDFAVVNFKEGKPIPVGGGLAVFDDDSPGATTERGSTSTPNLHVLVAYKLFSNPLLYALYKGFSERFGTVSAQPGSSKDIDPDGEFLRLPTFQRSLATRIFQDIDHHREIRNRHADEYRRHLSGVPGVDLVEEIPQLTEPHYIRFPILVDPERRETIQERLLNAGIEASRMYGMGTEIGRIDPGAYPGGAEVQRRILTLPVHHRMSTAKIREASEIIGRSAR